MRPLVLLLAVAPALCAQASPWREDGVAVFTRDGRPHWRATAALAGADEAEARQAAEAEARRMLATSAQTRIISDLRDAVKEHTVGGRTTSESKFTSEVRALTDHAVRNAIVARLDCRREGAGFRAYAEVEVAEADLIPTRRLTAALAARGAQALLAVADGLEADGWWPVAEQALLFARDREPSARFDLRLGQHHEKRGNLDAAAQWFTLAEKAADAEVAATAGARLAAIRARVPNVAALAAELEQLARARGDVAQLRATVKRDPGTVTVHLHRVPSGRRVLCTWIDDVLRLHYRASQYGAITTPMSLPLAWPPAENRPKNRARLLLWSLAVDDPQWRELDEHVDRDWPLTGDVDVADRMRLRDLITRLRASDATACWIDMDGV